MNLNILHLFVKHSYWDGYHGRKWTWLSKLESQMRLSAFHIALKYLGKVQN